MARDAPILIWAQIIADSATLNISLPMMNYEWCVIRDTIPFYSSGTPPSPQSDAIMALVCNPNPTSAGQFQLGSGESGESGAEGVHFPATVAPYRDGSSFINDRYKIVVC